MFRNSINVTQRQWTMLYHWFALMVIVEFVWCWSFLIFSCHDFIERNTPIKFWWFSDCFLAFGELVSHCCWFMFAVLVEDYSVDKKDWNRPKDLLLNRYMSTCPIYHLFSHTFGQWARKGDWSVWDHFLKWALKNLSLQLLLSFLFSILCYEDCNFFSKTAKHFCRKQ